jgi:hypothetical protein
VSEFDSNYDSTSFARILELWSFVPNDPFVAQSIGPIMALLAERKVDLSTMDNLPTWRVVRLQYW